MTALYRHEHLIESTAQLFAAAGLDRPIAQTVAEILVEAELLGYDTRGLQFIPVYIKNIENGETKRQDKPGILRDGGNTLLLDALGLPGQWATVQALEMAQARLAEQGVVTVVVRNCANISCLATYAKRAADFGSLAIITTSSPTHGVVAPPGGKQGRVSINPMAIGIPTEAHPILIDTSTASVSNRQIERTRRAGARLAQPVLMGPDGKPSDDPNAFYGDPKGAIMPVGGVELGHKGFAFSLMVEALTTSLAGVGRAEQGDGSNVFLQLIDPAAFRGVEAFRGETSALGDWCRDALPIDLAKPVRMPGDRAHHCWQDRIENGVSLHAEVPDLFAPVFARYGIDAPKPI